MKLIGTIFFMTLLAATICGCNDSTSSQTTEPEGLSHLQGKVVTPLADAYLYVYREGSDLYGPAFAISAATAADGTFEMQLPEGEYVAVVRRRQNGETSGPVVTGDYRSEFIPLKVPGNTLRIDFEAPAKVGDERRLAAEQPEGLTALSGQIVDSEGNPVEGARVHVYDHVQMSERPKFVSEKTGPDGRYRISLPVGGTYYLAARDKFGGPPKLGDLYGRYDQGTIEPSAVVVREGEVLKNVDISVTKVW